MAKKRFFNPDRIGEIRPGQIITTFGPGAITDARKDSVTVLDINYWGRKGTKIFDTRLASYLNVDYFKCPPTDGSNDVPVVSFPKVHVCSNPKCGRIFNIEEHFDRDNYLRMGPRCPDCGAPAYPSRFIMMCECGHLDDFPWREWVHGGKTDCEGHLRLKSTGLTSTLADLRIECDECGAKKTMSGAMQEDNFLRYKCTGRHPFRPNTQYERCNKAMRASQRGASNVYFPVIRSALSIPPWIDPLFNLIDEHYRDIINYRIDFGEAGVHKIYERFFADKYSEAEFNEALRKKDLNIQEYMMIKEMEYKAFTNHNSPIYSKEEYRKYFMAEEEPVSAALSPYFSRIIQINRLREIMVLLGFTRLDAPDPDADEQKNIVYLTKESGGERWLPGVEINGEGIFIEFNQRAVEKWLSNSSVAKLSKIYSDGYVNYCESRGWTSKNIKDGKYVLLHTFAHLLIKEMSLSSGYSTSAIKERIYSGENMCGILLYTGSSDKEGSLGGLVELGKEEKLLPIIKAALENALVCTSDPECMSHTPTIDDINGASCHACTMISETACENGNRLLDRGFVVPLPQKEDTAYFKELVRDLCGIEI